MDGTQTLRKHLNVLNDFSNPVLVWRLFLQV